MNISLLKNLAFFLILLLAQVLVLNHIHLFHCALPLLYVYFLLPVPRGTARWSILVWGFALGLAVDCFSNTPGVGAAATTLTAFLQPYVLELFLNRDSADNLLPSFRSLGWGKYTAYAAILILVHTLSYFALEAFEFYNPLQWLASVGGSFVLTLLLTLVIENMRKR